MLPRPLRRRWLALLALTVAAGACRSREGTKPAPAASAHAAPSSTPAPPSMARPYFVKAPERLETAQPFLKEQVSRARAAGERALVYVGASWCEPCERFHEAVEAGEL